MSSPSSSPDALPTTPDKERNMTVNKENTALRTPLPNAPVNSADKVNVRVEVDAPRKAGDVVQVPGTAPHAEAATDKSDEAQKSNEVDKEDEEHANNSEEAPSDSEAVGSEGASTDLPAFNWIDLQRRYSKALQEVNKQEDEILEEFERFSSAFSIWGQASANRDNERASKRLRTRENFVRLEEISLEAKKKHYTEVVDAFKKALALLAG